MVGCGPLHAQRPGRRCDRCAPGDPRGTRFCRRGRPLAARGRDRNAVGAQSRRGSSHLHLPGNGGRLDDGQAQPVEYLAMGRLEWLVAGRVAVVHADQPALPLDLEGDVVVGAGHQMARLIKDAHGETGAVPTRAPIGPWNARRPPLCGAAISVPSPSRSLRGAPASGAGAPAPAPTSPPGGSRWTPTLPST